MDTGEFDLSDTESARLIWLNIYNFMKTAPNLPACFPGGDRARILRNGCCRLSKYSPHTCANITRTRKCGFLCSGSTRNNAMTFIPGSTGNGRAGSAGWWRVRAVRPPRKPAPGSPRGIRFVCIPTSPIRCAVSFPCPGGTRFSLTLGREPINPQPVYYAFIHNYFAPFTIGFITYSDGINDDVNKTVWSRRGWDPGCDVRAILVEYARSSSAHPMRNVSRTASWLWKQTGRDPWRRTAASPPHASCGTSWRQRCRSWRITGDGSRCWFAPIMTPIPGNGCSTKTIWKRRQTYLWPNLRNPDLNRHHPRPGHSEACGNGKPGARTAQRIVSLYDGLFHSVGLKSSVKQYHASGYERGCSLDFLDYPLNNRWFLEDEFKRIRTLPTESAQVNGWKRSPPGKHRVRVPL